MKETYGCLKFSKVQWGLWIIAKITGFFKTCQMHTK